MQKHDIKVAVVGCGAVANDAHLPVWRKIKGISLVTTCDSNGQLARATAQRWKIPSYYTDFNTMLSSENPDVVDICTPPGSHVSLISHAIAHGCNIIVEKPLAMNAQDLTAISQVYANRKKTDLKLGVLYNWLFHPQVLKLMRCIENGNIGDILFADIKCFHPANEPMIANPKHWCHSMPGGRMGEVLIHPIYLLHHILGTLRPGEIHLGKRSDHAWVKYDELSVSLEGSRGFGNIHISFNSPRLEFPIINVYGSKGQLLFNGYNLNLLILNPENNDGLWGRGFDSVNFMARVAAAAASNVVNTIIGRHQTSHQIYFKAFTDCITGSAALPVAFEDAVGTNTLFLDIISRIV